MAEEKIIMDDEQMDQITGGTILPYRVKPGDNLLEIAKKYNVPVELLMRWNGFPSGGIIEAGQLLKIKF